MDRSNLRLLLATAATLSLSLLIAQSCATTGGAGSTLPDGFGAPEQVGRSLGPSTPDSWQPRAQVQPLRVIHRSPVSEAEGASAILVTFNQPMIALGPSADRQPTVGDCPIRVQPAVRGACRWVAGDTLKLVLSQPLKNAHRYTVTIPTTLKALSGAALHSAESWSFQTPLPELLRASPHPGNRDRADRLRRDDALLLTFNLEVRADNLERHARLLAGGKQVPCRATHHVDVKTKRPDPKKIVLRPRQPLPPATKVALVLPPGLRSPEGPLASRRSKRHGYATPGSLQATFHCDGDPLKPGGTCLPMSNRYHAGLEIQLTEPVTSRALARALRVTPRLIRKLRTRGDHWCDDKAPCSRTWALREDLRPRRPYRVALDAGLKDIFGQRLGRTAATRFKTRALPPGIFVPHDAEGFREAWQPYKIKAVNVQQIELGVTPLTGAALVRFVECLQVRGGHRWPERCGSEAHPTTQKLKLRPPADRVVTRTLPLPRGLLRMTLSSPQLLYQDETKKPVLLHRVVSITDLGLQARMTPLGVVAWVTGLKSGKAVASAEVAIHDVKGKQLWSGRTDTSGVAQCPKQRLGKVLGGTSPPRLYVLARHARDRAYLSLNRHDWYADWYSTHEDERDERDDDDDKPRKLKPRDLSALRGVWQGDRPLLAGYLSTERGIYRPGHRVHLHGAVRRFVTWRGKPAAGLAAQVELLGPSDEVVGRQKVKLSPLGVFKLDLPLPASVRLGYYSARLTAQRRQLASTWFKVAEYRPPRFSVHLRAKPEKVTGRGEVQVDLAARYMFGGPMDGAAYRMSARAAVDHHELPGGSEHYVGAYSWTVGTKARTWLRREGVLDRHGRMRQTLKLPPLPKQPFPVSHTVEAQVRSPAGRTVAARRYISQHPGQRYASVKTLPGKDREQHRHVLVVDPGGKVHGGARVQARLLQIKRRKDHSYKVDVEWDRELWRKALRVPARGALLRVPWPKDYDGDQALLVLTATDAAGREAWTAQRLDKPSEWSQSVNRTQRLRQRRDRQLAVKTDKELYLPGETAIITVQRQPGGPGAPAPGGEAMLFVERERVFRTLPLRFDGRGRATVKLKVEQAFARRVALRAVAPRRGPALRDLLGPLVTASAVLEVSDRPFHLGIKLKTDRETYRPGEEVKVALRVKDGLDRPRRAQVVLMAVDEAVLQLTAFRLPDPLWKLLHTPRLQVLADDVRRHLLNLEVPVVHRAWGRESIGFGGTGFGTIGSGGGGGAGHGRGAGSLGKRKRSRFKTTAWHATLVTDDKGRARTSFRLPDNLTRYRIMAFAVDARRSSGTGRTSFTVDLPLVTLPVLPRLLRAGDAAKAGVMIQNTALRKGAVKVEVKVEGKAIGLSGPAAKSVTLARGRSATVRFDLRARRAGTGKLTFSVTGPDGAGDLLVHELRVQPLALMESASVSGETRGAVAQGIAPLDTLQPGQGGLEVSLASTALTGVEDGMEQLIQYPYGCLEQKSSKLLPLIAAAVLGERFNLELPGKPAELIRGGVQDILAMQRHDGGFGYWPNARRSSTFATAYALIVLHRADLAAATTGVEVPTKARRRAVAYLRRYIDKSGKSQWWRSDLRYALHTFVVYALALHGKHVDKPVKALFDLRQRKPLFVRSMLLSALSASKASSRASSKAAPMKAALVRELSDSLRVDGTWAHAEENLHDGYKVLMHSNDRTTAMVLLALLAARPEHPMVPRLVRWFLLGRKQARFRNTQEAAWALLALWDYARIREKEVPDFEAGVWLGGARVVKARFEGRSVKPHLRSIPMAELMKQAGSAARQLMIAKRGRGTLYYVARLRYARKTLPRQAKDRGLTVRKRVQVLDRAGKPLKQQRPPRLDDTILVTLEVESNEARRYLVVDDPLPAGLEAIDTGLATAGRGFGAGQIWRGVSWFDHRELRDDRVLFFRDHKQPGKLTFKYLARVTTSGTFAEPPTKAEEMYTPEVYGHTAAGSVTYRAR